MSRDLFLCEFTQPNIERGDFSMFMTKFAFDRLPTGWRLRDMMDSMICCVGGYDADEREIHAIPEIRAFYQSFHEAWPYWLYFCNLEQDTLKIMVLCCVDSLVAMRVDGQPDVKVECAPEDVLDFIRRDFVPMNLICDRAEMFEDRIEKRTQAILEYFGFGMGEPSA